MAKPKEDEKSDGLEINSIGSLYSGTWDKKYWSSSRGKDRYPYPVGYQVVRAYNGSMYKIEIHEGPKGPSFVISSDGHSCSGQTPDIAWGKFQKNGCPRTKILNGKRFSSKIDGVEFFGFKNQLVQRLLRELVANVNGTAERSLLSSNFCNGASRTDHDIRHPDACTVPDLLPFLAKPQNKGKRSRKREIISAKAVNGARLKRSRPQDLVYDADTSRLTQENQRNYNCGCFMPASASEEEYDVCKHPGALPASVHLISGSRGEKSPLSVKDEIPLDSIGFSDHLREEAVPTQEERELDDSENCKSAGITNNLPAEEKPLGRLLDNEVEFNFQIATENQNGNVFISKDSPGVQSLDLCAPDTFDCMQDSTSNSAQSSQDKSTYSVKEALTAADLIISEGLVDESHLQEEIGTSNSNANSEKSDCDSVGQEMVKSMMTFLLPQAVPLLKNSSRKKKAPVMSQGENTEAVTLTNNVYLEKDERMHIQSTALGSGPGFEHTKSVVPDSYEDEQCGDLVTKQVILSSDIGEANQVTFDKDTCPSNTWDTWGQLIVQNKPSGSHVETNGSKDILCYNEVHMTLNEKPQKGDGCVSESVLACTSHGNKILPENINSCATMDENLLGVEILSKENQLNTVPDCTEANSTSDINQRAVINSKISFKEISVKRGVAEPGITFFTQTPNKVYTRKKVQKISPLSSKNIVPLLESIICRNHGEHPDPETDPATGTLLASEIHQLNSTDDKSSKRDLFGAQVRLGGQLCGSHTQNMTINTNIAKNNTAAAMSQYQALSFASDDKDTSDVFQPCGSHVEKSQVHFDDKLVGNQDPLDSNSPTLFLNQNTSFAENNTLSVKGVPTSLDIKLHRNLELNSELNGIVELVGCYVHPMPVSSVFLSNKDDEIYICVLCGLLVDRDKTLFIYKLSKEEPGVGCPSFVGHTSITLPSLKDYFGREVELERSGLQFTPDGQLLVLFDSIKTPYCREGKIQCLCSTCKSDCFKDNAVKIVRVKFGYVSVVVKLTTVDNLQCILVCEPNYLVTVGESGRLHLCVMNSTWSAQTEEFIFPAHDTASPGIMELKRIPKCASLVVGHNGFGEFSIWDISKRIFLSSFSAPSSTIYQFFPISLFSWKRKGPIFSNSSVEENAKGIMAATKMWFSDNSENSSFLPLNGEDMAVWLLVSTISNPDAQIIPSECQNDLVGCWRLALLVKDMVVLGSALDPRAVAIGASAGHGIIGTCDGLVYMWELSTGAKLGMLHHFKGGSVSCVATDDSKAGALAVAGDGGQLLVYLHTQKYSSS
ncbi:hypothetical protein SO802_011201 [Lithocarpus litseifolius]|uniref:Uncharacterized protein n=1 Tax=Lithocarpus litseifolius TaxID=425828 RepID=A0AAW2D3F2_9ROSI